MTLVSPPARDHDLVAVQCLRGVAAMMVVVFHCFPQLERMGYAGNQHLSLSSGVDIFFIISGFIMLFSAHRSPGRGSGAFLANRAVRIIPIYWLLTSVMVAIALVAPQLLSSTRYETWHVIASYLMIPALHPVMHLYWPILIPGWTLNCEAFFYVLFAVGLAVTRDRRNRLALIVGGGVTAVVLAPLVVPVSGVMSFYTDSVMIEFVFGLGTAILFLSGRRMPLWLGIAAMALGAAALVATDYVAHPDLRGAIYGVPALAIFGGAVFARWPAGRGRGLVRGLRVLGDASYSIYLTHMITMGAMGQVWRRLLGAGWPGAVPLFILVTGTVCALVGLVFYTLVEQPLTRRLKRVTVLSSRPRNDGMSLDRA
jgi:exopolysaccharide production protein ExoZ